MFYTCLPQIFKSLVVFEYSEGLVCVSYFIAGPSHCSVMLQNSLIGICSGTFSISSECS